MKLVLRPLAFLPCVALLLTSCSSKTQIDPKVRPDQLHHIFVEHLLADGHNVDELIARELRRLGYDASAGPMTMMPDGTEAILAYQAEWTSDFTTYLIELDVALRDQTGKEIAVGQVVRPSVMGNDTNAMVVRVIDPIFKAKK
jgi:hypothetical protein